MPDLPPVAPESLAHHVERELRLADYFELEGLPSQDIEFRQLIASTASRMVDVVSDLEKEDPEYVGLAFRLSERLARRLPLIPLTGEDDEWGEADEEGTRANLRCPRVILIQAEDGSLKAFDSMARAFQDPRTGHIFYAPGSEMEIEFPYEVPLEPVETVPGLAFNPPPEVNDATS